MLEVGQRLAYKAFGLTFSSQIHFPELEILDDTNLILDFEIKIGDLSKVYFELSNEPDKFVIKENFVIFQISSIATFSISGGNKITVSPMEGSDEDQIRLLILGTCMSALLMQRKILPLHGSVVAINGKAYAFIGNSGAGKSTLASAFVSKDYKILSDDVIAVSLYGKGSVPYVIPSYPQQKLWQDSLSEFGMNKSNYRSIFGRENKYSIPITSNFYSTPLPLAGVFELIKSDCEEVGIRRIEKLESFSTFSSHTFRNFLIPGLGLMDWHFRTITEILNKIKLYQLQRPALGTDVQRLVSIILNTINKGD
ncbi:hypothetical protein F4694_000559 [Bacillus niacini]|uniref:Aldolase n=1 Tax=Neobacillus niacini TaxID=86668 RepID=A0A852T558_9BACI|nr:aldolase [Neobacillus niacini]NYE03840.1 hypothetical protein [Neobacillus niacini]